MKMNRILVFFIPAFLTIFITSPAPAEEWYERLESSTIVYAPNVNRNITPTGLAEKRSGNLESLKSELRSDIQRAQAVGLQGSSAVIGVDGWNSLRSLQMNYAAGPHAASAATDGQQGGGVTLVVDAMGKPPDE